MKFKKITVITGHYGSGKTNFAVNLAFKLRELGKNCSLVDLDIVNPYFRTADFKELLAKKGIGLKASQYANSNLDIPSLSIDIDGIISETDSYTIIDVGGDDAGAAALGRYSEILNRRQDNLDMLYVVNSFRYLTRDPADTIALMRDIESVSKLKCTGIVNNSNLGYETVSEDIEASFDYAEKSARMAGLPIVATVGKIGLLPCGAPCPFPVEIYVNAGFLPNDL